MSTVSVTQVARAGGRAEVRRFTLRLGGDSDSTTDCSVPGREREANCDAPARARRTAWRVISPDALYRAHLPRRAVPGGCIFPRAAGGTVNGRPNRETRREASRIAILPRPDSGPRGPRAACLFRTAEKSPARPGRVAYAVLPPRAPRAIKRLNLNRSPLPRGEPPPFG